MKNIISFFLFSIFFLLSFPAFADEKKEPLGDFNLGATVGLGLGFPSPISGQVLGKYKKVVGVSAEYGFLPQLTFSDVKFRQHMFDFAVNVYPFKGAFFLGAGIGHQEINARYSQTQNGITGQGMSSVSTTFIQPRLGFLHVFSFGLAIGMDLGVEIPVSGSVESSSSLNGIAVALPSNVSKVENKVKTTVIPTFHLLNLGYQF